jgi:hypothetical protein
MGRWMASTKKQNRRKRIAERDGYRCHWCGSPMRAEHQTLDHKVRIRDGGTNAIDNLVLAHPGCNGRREHRPCVKCDGPIGRRERQAIIRTAGDPDVCLRCASTTRSTTE